MFLDNGVFERFSLWATSQDEFVSACSSQSSRWVNEPAIHLRICAHSCPPYPVHLLFD